MRRFQLCSVKFVTASGGQTLPFINARIGEELIDSCLYQVEALKSHGCNMELPFSQACENNKDPILEVLKTAFSDCTRVLEVGSGTGQHAVYFASQLPNIHWQASDQKSTCRE